MVSNVSAAVHYCKFFNDMMTLLQCCYICKFCMFYLSVALMCI